MLVSPTTDLTEKPVPAVTADRNGAPAGVPPTVFMVNTMTELAVTRVSATTTAVASLAMTVPDALTGAVC